METLSLTEQGIVNAIVSETVKCLKAKYEKGGTPWMTLKDIVKEIGLSLTASRYMPWLKEALHQHPEIIPGSNTKYAFKNYYKVKSADELLSLITDHEMRKIGGIPLEDIQALWEGAKEDITQLIREGKIVSFYSVFDGLTHLTHPDNPICDILSREHIQSHTRNSGQQVSDILINEFPIKHNITVPEKDLAANILSKILKCLKTRCEMDNTYWITLKEILEETGLSETVSDFIPWLKDALREHPKIIRGLNNEYMYQNCYKIKSADELLSLINDQQMRGMGSIPLEDIEASWEGADKDIAQLIEEGKIVSYWNIFDGVEHISHPENPFYHIVKSRYVHLRMLQSISRVRKGLIRLNHEHIRIRLSQCNSEETSET